MAYQAEIDYPHVFSPFSIKGVTLRNRIVRTSQGTGLTAGGIVNDDTVAWHLARARGGVGLGYTDPGQVHWSSPAYLKNTSDEVIEGLQRLTTAVHAEGMKMFEQLMHGGPTNMPQDGSSPWGASAIPDPGLGMVSRPMTQWMIDEVVAGFAAAAVRAQQGGLDGIEIHGGHGYLFSAFLSTALNHRTDAYGGTFENRIRLLREVLLAIRASVGPDFPVGVRLSPDNAEGHSTADDVLDIALALESERLVDFVNVSLGSHYGRDTLMGGITEPHGYQLAVTGDIVRKLSLPTIVTGRLTSIADAEAVLADGAADLVGMLRATIADPEVVLKTMQGRADEVRPCIACIQACGGGLNTRGKVTCTVNPAAGREIRYGDDSLRTDRPRRLVVVGGGPAGIEAARAGAIAGHQVTLLEAGDELGGQIRMIRNAPERAEVATALLPYYATALEKLDVDVRLGVTATAESIAELTPEAVIFATGSAPRRDGFQTWAPWGPPAGFEDVEILTGWDIMQGAATGDSVLLLDEIGHYESTDVAEALIERGVKVHYVTRFSAIAANLEMRFEMIGAVHARLLYHGDFHLHTRSLIHEMAPGRAVIAPLEAPQLTEVLAVDTFVFLSGNVPDTSLYEQLRETYETRLVGDAVGPRLLEAATFEGNNAVRSLEPGWQRPIGLKFGQSGSAI